MGLTASNLLSVCIPLVTTFFTTAKVLKDQIDNDKEVLNQLTDFSITNNWIGHIVVLQAHVNRDA